MILNLRPMSEALPDEMLLVKSKNQNQRYEWAMLRFSSSELYHATEEMYALEGFYLLADVLAAVELLRAITPDGCELLPELIHALNDPKACVSLHPDLHVRVKVRKLPEPVEVRYECGVTPKRIAVGEYFQPVAGTFICANEALAEALTQPIICYRRVEVKR